MAAGLLLGAAASLEAQSIDFATLKPNQTVHGFRAAAVYVDASNRPIGARFIHNASKFTLDVIRQQSVPQADIRVTTFPVGDQGEPHTQEHLLVGKGSKGRALGTVESASLATSTAYTALWETVYQFNTAAGANAFYRLFDTEMDALLNPSFNDEEIRREVRNFGVTEDGATHALTLEEKGSVYNEMTTSSTSPVFALFRETSGVVYGRENPLARQSGGMPEGIRTMRPADIRRFHDEHYYPGNMSAIVAIPDAMRLDDLLTHAGATLTKYNRTPKVKAKVTSFETLPKYTPAPEGAIRIVTFPHANAQQPGQLLFAWPATLDLDVNQRNLLSLFLETVAGDPTTNLYKVFIDTRTRKLDIGAKQIGAGVADEPGYSYFVRMTDVDPRAMTEAKLDTVRTVMLDELRRIAALPDGSPELTEFNARVKSRILSRRRALSKFVNSPPRFGFRDNSGQWNDQIDLVNRVTGFTKSLVLTPAMHFADSITSVSSNAWRDLLPKWRTTTAAPYVIAARSDPSLVEKEAAERRARVAAEIARLRTAYKVGDDQEAVQRYKADYDRTSAELERLAAAAPRTKLVADVPMTLDDQLQYKVEDVRGVPVVSSTFESMTSMTAGLALKLDPVAEDELVYVAAMPVLLTRVGIIKNGTPMSYEQMSERQRREILSLTSTFSTNVRTGRVELVVRGAGNDSTESIKALGWMTDVLSAPDWRPENLPRIRDVVDQSLAQLRNTQSGAPEAWVQGVANSYRRQRDPRFLTGASFLTRQNELLRLRWLLKDPGDSAQRATLDGWLAQLGGASAPRPAYAAALKAILDTAAALPDVPGLAAAVTSARQLTGPARALTIDVARDLTAELNGLPDANLAGDWGYLVWEIRQDLSIPPAAALKNMDALRARLLSRANARAFLIGSTATRRAVAPALESLIAVLGGESRVSTEMADRRIIDERLRARVPGAQKPTFVGLLDANMQGGVMMFSIPSVTYEDTTQRALTRFLASKIYGGGGAHSIFSQTIAAGLAYSNGIGGSPTSGRLTYYAERTPELPQTLRFVIEQLKKSPHDTSLAEYAMTLVFAETRAGADFETRGEAMANDLADGQAPASVKTFREKLLALRKTHSQLGKELYTQMDSVYADLLPGYNPGMPNVPNAVYFVIGSEKQLTPYEKYLKSAVSPDAELYRLYARDFWITPRTTTVP